METVEFPEVEVLDASAGGLLCRIHERDVLIPWVLVEPGSGIRSAGDRGTLVIQRWLAIGLGLVSPFPLPDAPRHGQLPGDVVVRAAPPSLGDVAWRRWAGAELFPPRK
jgi:hypothetical protein